MGGYSTSPGDPYLLVLPVMREQDVDMDRIRRAGALSAALALAVLWVASAWEAVSFAPAALAGALLRAAPGDLATFFIENLGHWARPLLVAGVLLMAVIVGAEALRRTSVGAVTRPRVAAAVLGVVAGIASVVGPSPGADLVATLFAVAAASVVYALAAASLTKPEPETIDPQTGRREFMKLGAGAATGLVASAGVIGWLLRRLGGPDTNVELVAPVQAAVVPERGAFPEISGLTPEVTSVDDHYVVDINLIPPSVEAEGWNLDVRGEVGSPAQYTFASLQESFEIVEEFAVLTCISNEVGGQLIGHSRWGGVRLAEILEAAGVREGAMDVVFYGADGYTDSIPLEVAMHPTVLVAVSQNGRPLTQAHGFPCRVRVPAIYGMKNVKWLEAIEVVPTDYKGYWMQRGWSDEAVIDTESRIDVAGESNRATVGEETWVAGIAWAGIRGVSKVEVSTDGGTTWAEAMLKDPISPISWRHWAYPWTPSRKGRIAVMARATDGDGRVQVAKEAPPHPDGATGYPVTNVEVG
jgi:DMSO/TMAO reductase YedYZ molybdopterin-dependent catalytic subunit